MLVRLFKSALLFGVGVGAEALSSVFPGTVEAVWLEIFGDCLGSDE